MSFDITHMTGIANLVAINVETPKIDSECFLKREFTKLIYINQADSNDGIPIDEAFYAVVKTHKRRSKKFIIPNSQ